MNKKEYRFPDEFIEKSADLFILQKYFYREGKTNFYDFLVTRYELLKQYGELNFKTYEF